MNAPWLVGHKSPMGCGTRVSQLADGMTDLCSAQLCAKAAATQELFKSPSSQLQV